ncbi:hypothetical protein QQG55_14000 [Brugia pahangi]|uniref:HMG box domain-containing protein n=1 Tax=Brugia pahangi TaxID=6280 RepID=A0A0N4T1A0_BRUPA|nr:unnamed protein product [Brugia pahangi]
MKMKKPAASEKSPNYIPSASHLEHLNREQMKSKAKSGANTEPKLDMVTVGWRNWNALSLKKDTNFNLLKAMP